MLGGKRQGLFGGQDVEAGAFSIECKSMSNMPGYLRDFYAQAERHAEGRIPAVAIHQKNHPYDKDFVMIRLDVWMTRILPLIDGDAPASTVSEADLREIHQRLGELIGAS